MPESQLYAAGAWVVHRDHGIGQVKNIETKSIGGKANTYCKIQTFNSTLWLPTTKMGDEWLRPVATLDEIKSALKILKKVPEPMANNLNSRKSRIQGVDSNDSPAVVAELLRDLWGFKRQKKNLSQAEEKALRHFTDCFLAEWSVSAEISVEEAKKRFNELLYKIKS